MKTYHVENLITNKYSISYENDFFLKSSKNELNEMNMTNNNNLKENELKSINDSYNRNVKNYNKFLIHNILTYIESKILVNDYIYLNRSIYDLFNFKMFVLKINKTDFLASEKIIKKKFQNLCGFDLSEIIKKHNISNIKNLYDIKLEFVINVPEEQETSKSIDSPFIELKIIDKLDGEKDIARITLININFYDKNFGKIKISLKELGLVENRREKKLRNENYYKDKNNQGLQHVNFPIKELSKEEREQGKENGYKFLEFLKNHYNDNHLIQINNICYSNKLSEFKEIEIKLIFINLNL